MVLCSSNWSYNILYDSSVLLKSKIIINFMRLILTILSFILLAFNKAVAQCAMCKGAAETSMEAGNAQASGINAGVLYVIVIVFIILSGFVFLFWKYRNYDGMYD